MPGKGKMTRKKGKKREKHDQSPLKKRVKLEEPYLGNDQSAISPDEAENSQQMPLVVQHLDDLAVIEVKRQMNTFSLLQLATVNRRFAHVLADQGKDVQVCLNALQNNSYQVNIRDGSGAKIRRKIDHNKLTLFLESVFQRLKQLREIATCYGVPDLGYCSLLRALMFHQVKVYRLHLRDEVMTLVKGKWELLSYCGGNNLHTLRLWQSGSDVPQGCSKLYRPFVSYEAEYATNKIEAFEKCMTLRSFRLVGWLTPTTMECIGQLKLLRRVDLHEWDSSGGTTFSALLDILAKNDKLRHLTVNDWEHFLTSPHASKLLCQLKSFGFAIDGDDYLQQLTADTLPSLRSRFLHILTMLGPDGRMNIELRSHNLFRHPCSRENAEAIVKNFITFWLCLSSGAGGSEIVLTFLFDYHHQDIIRHLLVSVNQVPIQLKLTYPVEWKIEQDRMGKKSRRYSIHYQGGSVALRRVFEE